MAVISLPVTMRELHPLQPPASGSPKLKLVDTGWTSGNHQRRLSYQCPNVYWAVSLVLNRPFLGALDHAGISPECLGSGAEEEDCCVCCQALFPCPGFLSWPLVTSTDWWIKMSYTQWNISYKRLESAIPQHSGSTSMDLERIMPCETNQRKKNIVWLYLHMEFKSK